ncbi:MAG: HAD family hydrolase [Caulobacterales bacterium]
MALTSLPRAILFDLDETILTFGHRRLLLQEVAERHAERFAPLTPAQAAGRIEAQFRAFWGDEARHKEWRRRLADARRHSTRLAFKSLEADGVTGLDAAFADAFADLFHALRESEIRFFPKALETLAELRRREVLMALVTNGDAATQRGKIERFDLAGFFDHIQIEGEHGFGKPEERAYIHALAALGVSARETWMVGDNLEREVAAPQRLGIFGIWHDHLNEGLPPDAKVIPDRIITSLDQLLE